MRLAVVRGQSLALAPIADAEPEVIDRRRGEDVLADLDDLAPASRRVEAEHELAVGVLTERVLELVAVVPLLDGGDDRLDRRPLEAADALQRIDHLALLLLELALVGEDLPRSARMGRARLDPVGRRLEQLGRHAPRRSFACA